MLAEWAPRLLRDLYERDVRRPYCPPALWLGPYLATEAAEKSQQQQDPPEERYNATVVMRVMLQGGAPGASTSPRQQARCGPCSPLVPLRSALLRCTRLLMQVQHACVSVV
jgi:ubiquitin-protein ligase E3 C